MQFVVGGLFYGEIFHVLGFMGCQYLFSVRGRFTCFSEFFLPSPNLDFGFCTLCSTSTCSSVC